MPSDTSVLLGQIGAPHGVKGEVRVKPFTGDPLAFGDYGKLHTKDGRKLKIKRLRTSKTMLVVKFEGVNTREEAEALNRVELFVGRDQLPDDTEDDEFYVSDLVGMDVLNETGENIGRVADVPDFGAGSLLEIAPASGSGTPASGTWLLEFSKTNVPAVDLDKRCITIVPPQEVSERDAE